MVKNPTYKFYTAGNKVIAVSSFAGATVRGVAKCNPNDEFDLQYGMALAAARCQEKIAAKRCKRAYSKVDEAKAQVNTALAHLEKMMHYESDAEANYNIASYELAEVLSYKSGCNCGENCDGNCECKCHD